MSNVRDLADVPPLAIWGDGVRARRVQGDRITLAVVELEPNAVVPKHVHENEQLGICLRGSGTFTIAGDSREIRPGTTWRITANLPTISSSGRTAPRSSTFSRPSAATGTTARSCRTRHRAGPPASSRHVSETRLGA